MFITNIKARYRITGDPKVRKEAYIKNNLILEVATPNFSPSRVQTPKALLSKKCWILSVTLFIALKDF